MNLRVPWNARNFLTSCKPVSCSGRTLHHGVSKVYIVLFVLLCTDVKMATFCIATEQLYICIAVWAVWALLGHWFSTFSAHGRSPKMGFCIPVTVKTFTGQQTLIAGILFVATGEAAIEQYDTSTNTLQLNIAFNTNWPKHGGPGDYSSIANSRIKIPAIFRGIVGISRGITKSYLLSPRLNAEPLTMVCRTLT